MKFKNLEVGKTYSAYLGVEDNDTMGFEFIFLGNNDSDMYVLLKEDIGVLKGFETKLEHIINLLKLGVEVDTQTFSEALMAIDEDFYEALVTWRIYYSSGILLETILGYPVKGVNVEIE